MFNRVDLRIGKILEATVFARARRPAYKLKLDFGPLGIKNSSAQLTFAYPDPSMLVGQLVVAVVNFAPRNVAGFMSEVLVTGFYADEKAVFLLQPRDEEVPLGSRVTKPDIADNSLLEEIPFDLFLQSKIILDHSPSLGKRVALLIEDDNSTPICVQDASGSPIYLSADDRVPSGAQLF